MKTNSNIKSIFIFLCFFSYSNSISTDATEAVKSIVAKTMNQYNIPGVAVALYVNHESHLFNFGYANKKKKKVINEQTLFEVGSITKVFTCLLIAREVISGTMILEDSLKDHIPFLSVNKKLRTLTLEKLCTHTSGLSFNAPSGIRSKQMLLDYYARWKPTISSLTWNYSNHGIELLRFALEESLQASFNSLLVQNILMPIGMAPIGIKIPDYYLSRRATPYGKDARQTIYWNHPFLHGSAALYASSSDMLLFLKAALGIADIPEDLKKAMRLTQTAHVSIKGGIQYGLGWQINNLACLNPFHIPTNISKSAARIIKKSDRAYTGKVLLDKTGTTNGFHAYIGLIPNEKIGVVIMMNRALPSGYRVVRKMGRDILRALRT